VLTLWADSAKHFRENAGYVGGYVVCSAFVTAVFRISNSVAAMMIDKDAPPAWMPAFRLVSLLWLAVGASLCAAAFFSLVGKRIDRPLWKCSGWRDGVRRFFLPWFILFLCQIVIIDMIGKLADAGMTDALSSLFMLELLVQAFLVPVGACIMYWGRMDWKELPSVLGPIYGQFLLVLPVVFIGVGQWLLAYMRADLIPTDSGLDILWLGLYDAVLDYITCFAFVMMWRVCMVHRDKSMEGGENPFDF